MKGQGAAPAGEEAGILDLAVLGWRHRWLIAAVCVVTVAATFVVTISKAKIYESSVALIAPREGTGTNLLVGLAAGANTLQLPGLSLPSLTPNRDLLISILKSRTVAQALVEQFGLKERYGRRYLEEAVETLQARTRLAVSKEGVISLTVEDVSPQDAARIANAYIVQLQRLVTEYGVGEAGRQRVFLADQLARAKVRLDAAEDTLRRFQERNRAIVLQDQTRGAIEAAARLKGEMMATEVQLRVMRSFATEANPEVIALRQRVDEMGRQLAQMQYGERTLPAPGSDDRRDFAVPFAKVPEVGQELARLIREAKVQETLFSLLSQQVEQVRIAEARDLPVVQVLDPAVPAERPSGPRLRLNLAVAGVVGLVAGLFLAVVLESFKRRFGLAAQA